MTTPAAAPTTAWLVELRDRGVCRGWLRGRYVVDDRNFGWTLDPNAAIRFCRKVDADAYRERHGFTATAESCTHLSTEHMWIDREQRDPTRKPEPLCPICGTHHRKPHPDSNLDWLCSRNDMIMFALF